MQVAAPPTTCTCPALPPVLADIPQRGRHSPSRTTVVVLLDFYYLQRLSLSTPTFIFNLRHRSELPLHARNFFINFFSTSVSLFFTACGFIYFFRLFVLLSDLLYCLYVYFFVGGERNHLLNCSTFLLACYGAPLNSLDISFNFYHPYTFPSLFLV